MVTPCLIKYSMGEKASGKVVGALEALNTIGSIIGTFIPTFITIPTIGTGFSFLLFGLLVFLVSAAYFLAFFYKGKGKKPEDGEKEENPIISGQKDCKTPSDAKIEAIVSKPKKKRTIGYLIGASISSLAVIAGCVLTNFSSFDFWDKTIVYQGESEYNYLQVKEDNEAIYFSTNVMFGVQSMIKKDGSLTGLYYDDTLGAAYMADGYKKGGLKMLILGMGTGTVATLAKTYLPFAMDISGVEIDQKIIDLSREYFRLPNDVDVYCDDGRSYPRRRQEHLRRHHGRCL
jgi:predicted membrane-bound spermidine synthase